MPTPKQPRRTYAKPLSLAPLTFGQALTKLLAVKPTKPKKKSRPKKPAAESHHTAK